MKFLIIFIGLFAIVLSTRPTAKNVQNVRVSNAVPVKSVKVPSVKASNRRPVVAARPVIQVPTKRSGTNQKLRVANGTPVKTSHENLDYCTITIEFLSKTLTCGGVLFNSQWILTSARCLTDCTERPLRVNATAVCGYLTDKSKRKIINQVTAPDGNNGAMAITTIYDPCTDTDFGSGFLAGGQATDPSPFIALARLETPYTAKEIDGKKLAVSRVSSVATPAGFSSTQRIKVCGYNRDSKGKISKKLSCVDMTPRDATACRAAFANIMMPDDAYCLTSISGSVCQNDFGGPAYVYTTDEKRKITSQELVCTVVASFQHSGRCGNTLICLPIQGAYRMWINNVITPPAGR